MSSKMVAVCASLFAVTVLGKPAPLEVQLDAPQATFDLVDLVELRYLQENVTDNETDVPTPAPTTKTPTPAPTTKTPTATPTAAPTPPRGSATCPQCRAGCIINGVCAAETENVTYSESTCTTGVGTWCPPVIEFELLFTANDPAAVLMQDTVFMGIMSDTGSNVLFGTTDKSDRVEVTLSDVVANSRRLQNSSGNAIKADYFATLTEAEAQTIGETFESDPEAALAMFIAAFDNTSYGFEVDTASIEALIGSIQAGVTTMQTSVGDRMELPTATPTPAPTPAGADETDAAYGISQPFGAAMVAVLLSMLANAVTA